MGKTKIKTIDDSDKLVEKLKQELGIKKSADAKAMADKEEKPQETKKTVSAKKRSKKYLEAGKDLDKSKTYPLPEALDMVKKMSYSKFNGTIEAHVNTAQTGLRGFLQLPYVSGKKLRILAFGKGADQSGASIIGTDSTIDEISNNKIEFDLILTTPQWMSKLTKVAKILGPKGLMPNPKNGTITDDLKKAVDSFQAGKTEFKTETKARVIHLGLGKLNQPDEELAANIKAAVTGIGKNKIKKVTLSATMGAGVKLDLASV